jgi:uncharacterized membrane protein YphA (DoxX/SURF4 family)
MKPQVDSTGAFKRVSRWLSRPQPIERLAFLRIAIPLVLLGFLSSRLAHADYWLSPVGFRVPYLGGHDWRQPLYLPAVPPTVAWILAVATVLAGLCLSLGLFVQPAAGLFAALLVYLALADRLEAFTVSKLGPILVIALLVSPCGARYGVDAWRKQKRQPTAPVPTHVSGGVIRFFQILVVVMYSGSGIAKIRGDWLASNVLWSHLHDGYQTEFAWQLLRVLPGRAWQVLQDFTLVFEVGAPLWFVLPWTRFPALVVGLAMHAMIGLMFGPVIWFALLMATILVGSYGPDRWLFRLFRPRGRDSTAEATGS